MVGQKWRVKLLSAATDGAQNIVRRYQGAATRLEKVSSTGFFRIWCVTHQLDLFIQNLMIDVINFEFYEPMIALISYLLRQTTFINEMGCKFPTVCSTRWSTLGSATKWLVTKKVRLTRYMCNRGNASWPSESFWIFVEAVKAFMSLVYICFQSIQGRETLFSEQTSRSQSLVSSLKSEIGIHGPLNGADLLIVASESDTVGNITMPSGAYVITKSSVELFIEKCSSGAEESFSTLDFEQQNNCFKLISALYSETFDIISNLSAY